MSSPRLSVVPAPTSLTEGSGAFALDDRVRIVAADELARTVAWLQSVLRPATGLLLGAAGPDWPSADRAIVLGLDARLEPSGYRLDVTVDGEEATLENVAVHPDHQCAGIGTTLLSEAVRRCSDLGVRTLTAWTREDPATLRWYRSRGFEETFRYLHVYASHYREDLPAGLAPLVLERTGADLVGLFLHAPIEREAELRAAHRRVYVDRSFVLHPEGPTR